SLRRSSIVLSQRRSRLKSGGIGAHFTRCGNGNALFAIFLELVAQGADRDAENIRRMGAVSEAVVESLQNEILFHFSDCLSDKATRNGIRCRCRLLHDAAK